VTPEQADILWELESRGIGGVDGVYAIGSRRTVAATVVVLDAPDAYVLGCVTGALLWAIPDRDRSHVGVSTAARFHGAFADVPPLSLDELERAAARTRAKKRAPPVEIVKPTIPRIDQLDVELVWFIGPNLEEPLVPIPDPFRSLDPSMPIVVTRNYATRDRRYAWQAESVGAALERLSWAKPKWIACDEELALGPEGLLDALAAHYPHWQARTMVIVTDVSADFMERLIARSHPQVRVVTRAQ
jgi:hypothetical protein